MILGGGTILWLTLFSSSRCSTQPIRDNKAVCAVSQRPVSLSAVPHIQAHDLAFVSSEESIPTAAESGPPRQPIVGVTALLELQVPLSGERTESHGRPTFNLLVGDKRSNVHNIQLCVTEEEGSRGKIVVETSRISILKHGADSKTNLPVFSLAFETKTANILVGGGDRYISVWKQHGGRQNSRSSWQLSQRLGPHTGWVKTIACPSTFSPVDAEPRVYSVGCNRLVCWKRCAENAWRHFKTLSIDSNPHASSTLSSDLLCLAPCYVGESQPKNKLSPKVILAAGGVDGRIHFFWDNENDTMKPAGVIRAHNGRVNALHFDVLHHLLFSVSHDGSIHCWSLSLEGSSSLSVSLLASHSLPDDSRITVVTCWRENSVSKNHSQDIATAAIYVAVGTNRGRVVLLSLSFGDGDKQSSYQFCALQSIHIAGDQFTRSDDAPVVTALCKLESSTVLMIGHSRGIGYVSTRSVLDQF